MAGKETQNPSEPGAVTRSGRTVKPPERYGFLDIEHWVPLNIVYH